MCTTRLLPLSVCVHHWEVSQLLLARHIGLTGLGGVLVAMMPPSLPTLLHTKIVMTAMPRLTCMTAVMTVMPRTTYSADG
jgi:hypothetical protein